MNRHDWQDSIGGVIERARLQERIYCPTESIYGDEFTVDVEPSHLVQYVCVNNMRFVASRQSQRKPFPSIAIAQIHSSCLKVEDRFYWFRKPTAITLLSVKGEHVASLSDGDRYTVQGTASTKREAMVRLSRQVDSQIQALYRKLPMQMTSEEKSKQKAIESMFDLDRFRRTVKTESIELAQFYRDATAYRFDCFGGEDYRIARKACIGLFDTLRDGDWCEILVRKLIHSGRVDSIQFRRVADRPSDISIDKMTEELKKLPKADFPPLADGPIGLK